MKNLYIIGGTMGVGKTATCKLLKQKLDKAVFLDGDWCWDADPFQITAETKSMVLNNISYLLNRFIRCTAYENIIFCWVMHQQEVIDAILARLDVRGCNTKLISLVCHTAALTQRLQKDIAAGSRQPDVIERSVCRLNLYDKLNTLKINVSDITAETAAEKIAAL